MNYDKKKRIAVFVLLFVILLSGFVFIKSANLATLEQEIIVKSGIKVEAVGQYTFGKGGLVLVCQDLNGDGAFKAYTRIPLINRYMKTYELNFNHKDQPLYLAVESWEGFQALTFQDSKLKIEGNPTGLGFAGRIPLWITLSALSSYLITYGRSMTNNMRKKKDRK